MYILGIESSCDDTCAAVVKDGRKLLSNCVASSAAEQNLYGGVVPEIASRRHIVLWKIFCCNRKKRIHNL